MPLVSIILPNYNYARYLPMRIESILNQTFTDFELVMLDDASTDTSWQIMQQYKHKDTRISILRNENNSQNPFIQWKRGIEASRGSIIWMAEADDWCEHIFLESLLPAFDNPGTDICFCQSYVANSDAKISGTWKYATPELNTLFTADTCFSGHTLIEKALIYENVLPNASAVLFRKSAYEKVGGVDIILKSNADWLIWLKMATNGNVAFINKALNYFRRHHQSVIANAGKSVTGFNEQYDRQMRQLFRLYVKKHRLILSHDCLLQNRNFMAYDNGNEALYYLQSKKKGKSLPLLITASLQLRTLGYFRKALKYLFLGKSDTAHA